MPVWEKRGKQKIAIGTLSPKQKNIAVGTNVDNLLEWLRFVILMGKMILSRVSGTLKFEGHVWINRTNSKDVGADKESPCAWACLLPRGWGGRCNAYFGQCLVYAIYLDFRCLRTPHFWARRTCSLSYLSCDNWDQFVGMSPKGL